MDCKQRVLFVFPDLMIGGASSAFLAMLKKIDYEKNAVDVLFLNNGTYRLEELPRDVTVLPDAAKVDLLSTQIRIRKICNFGLTGKAAQMLWKTARYKRHLSMQDVQMPVNQMLARIHSELCPPVEKEYDVAVAYLELWPTVFVAEKVKASQKVAWVHVDYLNSGLVPAIDAGAYEKMNWIVGVSEQCCLQLKKAFPQFSEKITWAENYVDQERVRKLAKSLDGVEESFLNYRGFRIVTVARLDIQTKGLDRIVNICQRLAAEGLDFRWYLVGGGSDEAALRGRMEQQKVTEQLYLLGSQENPYPYLEHADLFVLASRNEGKPITVTEAQILHRPVLMTECSSSLGQLADGNGICVPNDEESLYRMLKNILEGKVLLNETQYTEPEDSRILNRLNLL